jgi:ABC-type Fe3+/spermidine/putrescine transport system ATPase subunit
MFFTIQEMKRKTTNSIIQVNDLTKRYRSLNAVDHVSFEVKKWKIFPLLGSSGAGKTTTISMLRTVFATLFTGIAIKSTDSFFAVINFLTFPIMFTSTAFFPISFFPGWLKPIAQANPITLQRSQLETP